MDQLNEAIRKVALGFSVEEVTEEYAATDGELKLVKRKETRREIPPDLKAVKLLLGDQECDALTDEELEREKMRLIRELKEEED